MLTFILVPPHSIHDIIYRDIFLFSIHFRYLVSSSGTKKSIMSDDSFRVYTSSFGLSFLLAPFLFEDFSYVELIGLPRFMHGWDSFAIIRQEHLFRLEH